jgi:hypothetical protein
VGDKSCGTLKASIEKLLTEGPRAEDQDLSYTFIVGDDEVGSPLHDVYRVHLGGDDLEQKLAKLEAELERLGEQLSALRIDVHVPGVPSPPHARPAPRVHAVPRVVPSPAPRVQVVPHAVPRSAGIVIGGTDPLIAIAGDDTLHELGEEEVVVRSYELPEGKLKELTELMIRSDVPIGVRPLDGKIEVHATPRQHKIFKAFVELINPSRKGSAGATTIDLDDLIITAGRAKGYDAALDSYTAVAAAARDAARSQARSAARQAASACAQNAALDKLRDVKVVVPDIDIDLEFIDEVDDLLEALNDEVLVEVKELTRAAEELREQADTCKHDAPREASALLKAMRELQRQARELQRLARQLERQAEKIDEETR